MSAPTRSHLTGTRSGCCSRSHRRGSASPRRLWRSTIWRRLSSARSSTDLETERGAGVRTRNLRLTAIRSFFRFVSFEEPAHSALIQRVIAIPSKRHDKRQVHFLTRPEIEAILAAPDRTTWLGRRDHILLLLAAQTGLRLSELISLDREPSISALAPMCDASAKGGRNDARR